jgi:hypothetical protein
MGWATIWEIFAQTHLVTLFAIKSFKMALDTLHKIQDYSSYVILRLLIYVSYFLLKICPKFEDKSVSEKFSAQTEFCRIGPSLVEQPSEHIGRWQCWQLVGCPF